MIRFIIRLLINAVALIVMAAYIPGLSVSGYTSAVLFAVVFGLVNAIIGPIVKVFALPVMILTLGLFTFVINAVLFWVSSFFVSGVVVANWQAALAGAFVLTIISWITSLLLKH